MFEEQMRQAGVDWRMNLYGGAQHSFNHPGVDRAGVPGLRLEGSRRGGTGDTQLPTAHGVGLRWCGCHVRLRDSFPLDRRRSVRRNRRSDGAPRSHPRFVISGDYRLTTGGLRERRCGTALFLRRHEQVFLARYHAPIAANGLERFGQRDFAGRIPRLDSG
jgi:hypothetical protein